MSAMESDAAGADAFPCHTVLKLENMQTESRYVNGILKFFPPMYIQRYEAVSLIIKQLPWNDSIRKAVDYGCSELGFFLHLKYIPSIAEILEIDVDENTLTKYAARAAPLNADYLFSKRNKPLNVYLLAGSIGEYDDQLEGADIVIAIEVLEHLDDEVLQKVPHNIFHEIKPRLAIFTTPNADFNVLFSNLDRFRHPDHKFEWTRMELIKWTQDVVNKYTDYSVKLYGIGVGPEETEHLGCCTQIAVFERKPDFEEEFSKLRLKRGINNYKLVREYIYPYYVDRRSNELKIFHEVEYRLKFTFHVNRFFNTEDELFEIPLSDIYPYVHEWCDSEDALRKILLEQGFYVLERDGMKYLSYRGYLSDSSESEGNESVEMDEAGAAEEFRSENWDWDSDENNCDPDAEPGKNETSGACTEETVEVAEDAAENADPTCHGAVEDSNNLPYDFPDSAMAIDLEPGLESGSGSGSGSDPEPEIRSRSMSWSSTAQRFGIFSGNTLVRSVSLPVESFNDDISLDIVTRSQSLNSFF